MPDTIAKIVYEVHYMLREDLQVYGDLKFTYPENVVPIVPRIGEIFMHSKIGYEVIRVNHAIFREDHSGTYSHSILITADVPKKR
jgi:hypothetical protein